MTRFVFHGELEADGIDDAMLTLAFDLLEAQASFSDGQVHKIHIEPKESNDSDNGHSTAKG